ncbi:MAG: DUF3237 domain-containing protein [Opitutaceae bacterium]|nr:DUF3237 domain-containing protein [Opitutaceae bacterium]
MYPRLFALCCVVAGLFPAPGRAAPPLSVAPLQTEFVYEAIVTIDQPVEVGATPHGQRRYIPITGGTFEGTKIRGTILPGGADWQTSRPDGVTEVDALYSMRADDGTVIIVRNGGVITAGGAYMRTAPRFEAPAGPHAWLNEAQFVGSVSGGPRPGTVIIRVFRVL